MCVCECVSAARLLCTVIVRAPSLASEQQQRAACIIAYYPDNSASAAYGDSSRRLQGGALSPEELLQPAHDPPLCRRGTRTPHHSSSNTSSNRSHSSSTNSSSNRSHINSATSCCAVSKTSSNSQGSGCSCENTSDSSSGSLRCRRRKRSNRNTYATQEGIQKTFSINRRIYLNFQTSCSPQAREANAYTSEYGSTSSVDSLGVASFSCVAGGCCSNSENYQHVVAGSGEYTDGSSARATASVSSATAPPFTATAVPGGTSQALTAAGTPLKAAVSARQAPASLFTMATTSTTRGATGAAAAAGKAARAAETPTSRDYSAEVQAATPDRKTRRRRLRTRCCSLCCCDMLSCDSAAAHPCFLSKALPLSSPVQTSVSDDNGAACKGVAATNCKRDVTPTTRAGVIRPCGVELTPEALATDALLTDTSVHVGAATTSRLTTASLSPAATAKRPAEEASSVFDVSVAVATATGAEDSRTRALKNTTAPPVVLQNYFDSISVRSAAAYVNGCDGSSGFAAVRVKKEYTVELSETLEAEERACCPRTAVDEHTRAPTIVCAGNRGIYIAPRVNKDDDDDDDDANDANDANDDGEEKYVDDDDDGSHNNDGWCSDTFSRRGHITARGTRTFCPCGTLARAYLSWQRSLEAKPAASAAGKHPLVCGAAAIEGKEAAEAVVTRDATSDTAARREAGEQHMERDTLKRAGAIGGLNATAAAGASTDRTTAELAGKTCVSHDLNVAGTPHGPTLDERIAAAVVAFRSNEAEGGTGKSRAAIDGLDRIRGGGGGGGASAAPKTADSTISCLGWPRIIAACLDSNSRETPFLHAPMNAIDCVGKKLVLQQRRSQFLARQKQQHRSETSEVVMLEKRTSAAAPVCVAHASAALSSGRAVPLRAAAASDVDGFDTVKGRTEKHKRIRDEEDKEEEQISAENYFCQGCVVYCSDEPCIMCAMACVHSRIKLLVIGHRSSTFSGGVTNARLHLDKRLNHGYRVLFMK